MRIYLFNFEFPQKFPIPVDPHATVIANLRRTKLSDWTDDQLTVGGAGLQQVEIRQDVSTGWSPLNITANNVHHNPP